MAEKHGRHVIETGVYYIDVTWLRLVYIIVMSCDWDWCVYGDVTKTDGGGSSFHFDALLY